MIKRSISIALCMVFIATLLSGCGLKNIGGREEEILQLSEQQMSIFEAEELPLDYSQLTNRQQAYLKTADKMLTYINEKYAPYGVRFTYLAYHEPELLDKATRILVVPDGFDPAIDTVTVKINADVKEGYEDDYLDFASHIVYEDVIANCFRGFISESQFRVFTSDVTVDGMETDDLANLSEEYLLNHKVSSNVWVFISDEVCKTDEELIEITRDFFIWMKENDFYGSPYVVLCKDEGLAQFDPRDISATRKDYGISCTYGNVYEGSEIDIDIHHY